MKARIRSGSYRTPLLVAAASLVAAAFVLLGAAAAPAASPSSGTIGPPSGTSVSWTGQFYAIAATVVPEACPPAIDPANALCDHYFLTVDVPPTYWDTNTGGADISITWASPDNDFDMYVYDADTGTLVDFSAAGGTTSERVFIENASGEYEVRVNPFLVIASDYDGSATFVSQAGGPTPNPPRGTGGLAFSPPATVIDAQRTEGEPLNWIDKDGNYWETGPWGFSTGQSFIHRSVDGGDQFNIASFQRLRPNLSPAGGGDSDVVTDDQGFAYFADLEGLVEIGCAVTNDSGNNWKTNPACVAATLDDRQWLAMDNGTTAAAGDNTVFLAFRQVPAGSFIYSSPGSTGTADLVGGVAYVDSNPGPVSTGAPCGQLRFDPTLRSHASHPTPHRHLYYPCADGDHIELTVGHVDPGQRLLIDYENVQAPASPGGAVGDIFPAVAVDEAGTVYAVWVDEIDHNVYYAFSIDEGQSWSDVRQINGNEANSNVFPWAQAGDPGKLAVAWYGSSSHLDSDFMPSWYNNRQAATAFPWFGYASLITNASTASPSFAQQKFTDQPMHYGQICNQGLGCTVSGGDRTMADFMALYLDLDGSMRLVYNDTTSQHHGAHLFEVRQVAGPSAQAGTISKSVATNPVTDPTGDAQSPHYSPAGPGSNLPQFDFTQVKLSQPNPATLRVEMTVDSLGLVTPPLGDANSLWLTRFQALSKGDEGEESYRIFYVGAEQVGPGQPTVFFAGSGNSANNVVPGDGCTTTTPENCKIVQYPNEAPATGNVTGNTITIDVPIDGGFGPGRPILSDTLYNVTALSAGRSAPTGAYSDVDATRTFDFVLGKVGKPTPTGCKVTGGGAIPGTTPGSEAPFGINALPGPKGKVSYSDAGAGVNFRSTRILKIECSGTAARIEGEGVNNNGTVSFIVDVVDNGEAGTTDTFRIQLSGTSTYTRGPLPLTRGNIQIH
jgi:hypothetical protein